MKILSALSDLSEGGGGDQVNDASSDATTV